jgi:hypothetical protein
VSDYVDGVLKKFIAEYEGKYIDVTGVYGAQSPDLAQAYISRLLGREWIFKAGPATRLWEDREGTMTDFERVERTPQKQVSATLRPGDVLVFDGGQGFGTVGIYTGPGGRVGSVQMFTQNPGPAKIIDIMADGHAHKLLGAWRLTAAAECKILADKFAKQLNRAEWRTFEHAADQREPVFEIPAPDAEIDAAFDRGYEHAKTLPPGKREAVTAWIASHDPQVNYIEADPVPGWGEFKTPVIKSGRGHGKTAFIERLKARFGRDPK